jgi:type III restriction enzyme
LVELKGKTDELVPLKAASAREWCRSASKHTPWRYLYVPYHVFQMSPSATIEELERACVPSLDGLIGEAKTLQAQLPLDEETALQHSHDRLIQVAKAAGFESVPPDFERVIRQAVETLDWSIGSKQPTLGTAFQALFRPIDDLSIRIVVKHLNHHVPAGYDERDRYFDPVSGGAYGKQAQLLSTYQRYLRMNLVEGRSMQKLSTLLFCLNYANKWTVDGGGVWDDVRDEFCTPQFELLYEVLDRVNQLRNTKLAHEGEITDPSEATAELTHWVGCVCLMSALA